MLRRVLVGFVAVLAVTTSLAVGSAKPAAAFGGETFGCRVAPGTYFDWRSFCLNDKHAYTYNAGFAVLNRSGGGYTFQWTVSGPYLYVITGCHSASSDCAVAVQGSASEDKVIEVTVTYTQNGQSATKSATAYIACYGASGYC